MKYFRQKQAQKGFTLIELMIAVAIVGILAAVALPAFASYLTRARVVEGVNYAQGCKTGVIEYYASMGTMPPGNAEAGCTSITTENVASVNVTSGVITVNFQNGDNSALPKVFRDAQRTLTLTPLDNLGNAIATTGGEVVSWDCRASAEILDFVPAECRQAIAP